MYLFGLPPLFPLLKESIAPSYTMLGILQGIFSGMGLLMVLSGGLADRIGERKVILLEFFLIPLFLILCALAPFYQMLLVFIAGLGVAKCMYHPAGLSFLSKSVEPGIRGKVIGLHEAIGSIGSALAFIVLGALGGWFGWRYALTLMAVPSILLSFLYLLFGKKENSQNYQPDSSKRGLESILGIKKDKLSAFYLQMASVLIAGVGFGGFMVFLASFLHEGYHLSVGLAGGIVGIGYLGGFFGNLIGGRISDRIGTVHSYVIFTILTAFSSTLVAIFELPFYFLFLILLSCFFFRAIANPADKALLAKHSSIKGRGSGYGSLFSVYTLGSITSAPLFGFLIEKAGMRPTFLLVPVLLIIAAVVRYKVREYHR